MPRREWRLRIEDMLGAIAKATAFIGGRTYEEFVADDAAVSADATAPPLGGST